MREIYLSDLPGGLIEKEYHFDEKSGVELDQHIRKLEEQFPEAKIETKQDREGFTLVKVSQKREYKYNMEDILKFDPEKFQRKINETLEAILEEDNVADKIQNMSQDEMKQFMAGVIGGDYGEQHFDTTDIDGETKMRL